MGNGSYWECEITFEDKKEVNNLAYQTSSRTSYLMVNPYFVIEAKASACIWNNNKTVQVGSIKSKNQVDVCSLLRLSV